MTENVSLSTRASTAKELRRIRARRLLRRVLLGVGTPTLLAALYYGAIASPQYESVASFTIQSADGGGASSLELLIATVPGSNAGRDVLLVQEYALSRDMLALLREQHGFVEHYSHEDVDLASRLPPDAQPEEQFRYFQDHVSLAHDSASSVLTLTVRAFSSEKAAEIAQAILSASELMVNQMTERARQDRIGLAERAVGQAEERLTRARQAVVELQSSRSELNPQASAAALLSVRSSLEAELASARAELSTLRAVLQRGAPRLVEQRQRVAALAHQVERQTSRLVGEDQEGLHAAIARFEPLLAEKHFAERAHASALTSLELSRIEASRQHRYLVTLTTPSEPELPTHPDTIEAVLTVFVLSFALLSIGALLLASIREHANV